MIIPNSVISIHVLDNTFLHIHIVPVIYDDANILLSLSFIFIVPPVSCNDTSNPNSFIFNSDPNTSCECNEHIKYDPPRLRRRLTSTNILDIDPSTSIASSVPL